MDYYQRIAGNFQQTIELIAMSVDSLAKPIEQASLKMTEALLGDRKILACGNGPDAALAQLLVSNLLNRFEHDRPALPAVSLGPDAASLTAMVTSNTVDDLFARQLRALGQPGDVLLCLCSGDCHANLSQVVIEARERDIAVISVSNTRDPSLTALLGDEDVNMLVESERRPRVIEIHTMILHCLCELVEQHLFGNYNPE